VFTANATAVWHFADGANPPNTADVTRSTSGNSGPGGSGPATKRYVDANVSIAQNAVNEVNHQHVFTITSVATASGTTATLTSITPSVSPAPSSQSSTCANPQVNGNTATCTLTINSATPGVFTANATAVWHFADGANPPNTADVTRSTSGNSGPGGSGPATKRYVDANITITPPTATNPIGTSHTFTVTVKADIGDGNGMQPVGNASVSTAIANTNGATATMTGGTCGAASGLTGSGTTNAAGQCTIVISSPTAGTTIANATATLTVLGVALTRDTDPSTASIPAGPGGSGPAEKLWEGGGGQITPTQVDCPTFASGQAPDLDGIHYPSSGGKIGQGIDPGVFFFWTKVTTTVPNQTVTVQQSNTSTNNSALFEIHQGWIRLYAGNCSSWTTGTPNAANTGGSFTIPTAGTWIIGIKYNVKSLAGTPVPVPATITFNFVTSLGGATNAKVEMTKK